jgi:hypothetical protein
MNEETNIEKMVNSLTLLLGMATAMLFEMDKQMTRDQVQFFQWWKDAMYAVVYQGKPVPLSIMPDRNKK